MPLALYFNLVQIYIEGRMNHNLTLGEHMKAIQVKIPSEVNYVFHWSTLDTPRTATKKLLQSYQPIGIKKKMRGFDSVVICEPD